MAMRSGVNFASVFGKCSMRWSSSDFCKKLRRLHCVGVTYRVADVTDNIYKTDI